MMDVCRHDQEKQSLAFQPTLSENRGLILVLRRT